MNKKPPISKQQYDKLFAAIATSSKSTKSICKDIGICFETAWKYINKKKTLINSYARAKEEQADHIVESILERIQEGYNSVTTLKYKRKTLDNKQLNAFVQLIKIDTDALKWLASKLKPQRYGDKLELSGNKDKPLWPKKVSVELVRPGGKVSRNKAKKCKEIEVKQTKTA